MKRIISLLLTLFFIGTSLAKSDLLIQGFFNGIKENTSVMLCQYNYEDSVILEASIKSGRCVFNNVPDLQDGIYQVVIKQSALRDNLQNDYFFNLIIDKSESQIEFSFNPLVSLIPTFTKSNINKNWSEFLKLQNFRLAVINEMNLNKLSNSKGYNNFKNTAPEILKTEIKELQDLKIKFISDNFNKWSTYMVKYDSTELNFEEKNKERYWTKLDTSNPDLKNTPIYQELIRKYIISFYTNSNVDQYKIAFEEVIDAFSKNEMVKEWVIKYILTGLQKLGNEELNIFFSQKYQYKNEKK